MILLRTTLARTVAVLLALMAESGAHAQVRLFVNRAVTGGAGDGSSWANAFVHLADALAAAGQQPSVTEIWVARGIYHPDESSAAPNGSGDINATFALTEGLDVYGHFVGGETSLRQRALENAANATVLDGDLAENDGPNFANRADNARRVVTLTASAASYRLDGLTVRGGNADVLASPLGTTRGGGAVQAEHATFTLDRCRLIDNVGDNGGAIHAFDFNATLSQCAFIGNRAQLLGGAVCGDAGTLTVADCLFTSNLAEYSGGAIVVAPIGQAIASSLTITASMFTGNSCNTVQSPGAGGGAVAVQGAALSVTGSAFTNNLVLDPANNAEGGRGGAVFADLGAYAIADSTFTGNHAYEVGAVYCRQGPALIRGCDFVQNSCNTVGGAVATFMSDADIVACDFIGNAAGFGGGGLRANGASLDLVNCRFLGNSASTRGGGVSLVFGSANVVNSIFSGNATGSDGGGLIIESGLTLTLIHCAFSENACGRKGGAVALRNSGLTTARNCILWRNHGGWGGGPEFYLRDGADVDIAHSLVRGGEAAILSEGGRIAWGAGNLAADPRFADPDGTDGVAGNADDDLRLLVGSPAIDAAHAAALSADAFDLDGDGNLTEPIPVDVDGQSRFVDDPATIDGPQAGAPALDLGPLEFVPLASGAAGGMLWIGPVNGSFANPAHWFPDLPGPRDGALFDASTPTTVNVKGSPSVARLMAMGGESTLDLSTSDLLVLDGDPDATVVGEFEGEAARLNLVGGTLHTVSTRIGGRPDSDGTLAIIGPVGELTCDEQLQVGHENEGKGTLALASGGRVSASNGAFVLPRGVITGHGTIAADLLNLGMVDPGDETLGTLLVNGEYLQSTVSGGQMSAGTLVIDLTASPSRPDHDRLLLAGAADISQGGLVVNRRGTDVPPIGKSFSILEAGGVTGTFGASILPSLGPDRYLRVNYPSSPLAAPGAVTVTVEPLPTAIALGVPGSVTLPGAPAAADAGDLDGDGDLDLAIALAGSPLTSPGTLLVLINDGQGAFAAHPVQTPLGVQPNSLALAPLDAQPGLDVAVTNRADGTVIVRFNSGGGDFSPTPLVMEVGEQPTDVAAAEINGTPGTDLVVTIAGTNTALVLGNVGGTFPPGQVVALATGPIPSSIDPADVDNDRNIDLLVANLGSNSVMIFRNLGSGTFAAPLEINVGGAPIEVLASDLGSTTGAPPHVLVGTLGTGSLSILLNTTAPRPNPTIEFAPVINLPGNHSPRSLAAADLDGDADLEIVFIAEQTPGEPTVRILRNDSESTGPLLFTDAPELIGDAESQLVLTGDFNGDDVPDIVAIQSDSAADTPASGLTGPATPPGSVRLFPNVTPSSCPADLAPLPAGDDVVNVQDLLAVIGTWGACANPNACPADIAPAPNGDDLVNVQDLLAVIGAWGACP